MSDCSSNCSENGCGTGQNGTPDFSAPMNEHSNVKKVIGIVSGKGGVGKSFVTSYLSVLMNRKGYSTAILDADITGPSIPKAFGVHEKAQGSDMGIFPAVSRKGVRIMSANMLLETEETPVVWRGAMIANAVKQFWTDVVWGDVDYMFVDMPPGTGDVPLTVFQSLPVDGIIIVTSPQELVSMIVAKAVAMAEMMDIPVIGLIENYSYVQCGSCGEKINVFGESHIYETAEKFNLQVLGRLPLDPAISAAIDLEEVETLEGDWLDGAASYLEQYEKKVVVKETAATRIAVTTDENGKVFQHFGKTEQFTLYTLEDGVLMGKDVLSCDGKGHEELGGLLAESGVNVLICGGIGQGAIEVLGNAGITVIPGASGSVDVAFAHYLDGSLKPAPANCDHHHDHEEGGEGCHCH
ncbi:P-loop NTPase [Anaerolentibacter hominis]|uniref:P-loop NTPase n=1 Tax=Anaerolentibacter hominis TaxID=3079009 RepID=UPI003CCEB252